MPKNKALSGLFTYFFKVLGQYTCVYPWPWETNLGTKVIPPYSHVPTTLKQKLHSSPEINLSHLGDSFFTSVTVQWMTESFLRYSWEVGYHVWLQSTLPPRWPLHFLAVHCSTLQLHLASRMRHLHHWPLPTQNALGFGSRQISINTHRQGNRLQRSNLSAKAKRRYRTWFQGQQEKALVSKHTVWTLDQNHHHPSETRERQPSAVTTWGVRFSY